MAASRAGINLHENHNLHPKYVSALAHLFAYWISISGDERKKIVPDERLLQVAVEELVALGCPGSLEELKNWT